MTLFYSDLFLWANNFKYSAIVVPKISSILTDARHEFKNTSFALLQPGYFCPTCMTPDSDFNKKSICYSNWWVNPATNEWVIYFQRTVLLCLLFFFLTGWTYISIHGITESSKCVWSMKEKRSCWISYAALQWSLFGWVTWFSK